MVKSETNTNFHKDSPVLRNKSRQKWLQIIENECIQVASSNGD